MPIEKESKINDDVSFVFEQVHDFKNVYVMLKKLVSRSRIESRRICAELDIDHRLKQTFTRTFDVFYIEDFNSYCFKENNIYDLKLIAQNFITFEVNFQMLKITIDKYNLYLNM